ncbi:MAG: sulfatase-like hydrolase/transferase [Bacteroidota bacterium]
MKVNSFFYLFFLLPVLGLFGFFQRNQGKDSEDRTNQTPPNVLWVLTDDHRYDAVRAFNKMLHGREMSELGYVASPNIDRLTKQGTTFINAYSQAQGCAPSRASMHYGRYPFRSGIYEFEYHNNNTDNSYPHLPEQMEKLGYQTVHIGKLGVRLRTIENGKIRTPQIYQTDISFRMLANEGLAEWGKMSKLTEIDGQKLVKPFRNITYLKTEEGKYYYIDKELEEQNPQFAGMAQEAYDKFDLLLKHTNKKPETIFNKGILGGVSPRPSGKTRDGYYTSAFEQFLENESKAFQVGTLSFEGVDPSKPLFCHIGYDFPHTPVLPPADYRKRFQQYKYDVPELTDKEWSTMAKQMKKQVGMAYSNEFTEAQKQTMVQDYFAFCAYGDDLVGRSVDAFVEYSEAKNQPWLIVYVNGDHGWKLNDHGAYSKFTPWDIDAHNPIVVVSSDKKAFPAGKVVKNFSEFVDIAPTILAAAGADIESSDFDYLDGFDLAQVVARKAPERDYVIGESHAVTGPRAFIRTKDYVFSMQTRPNKKRGENMEWALTANYADLDPALYHMPTDPHEINNLAFDKKYKKVAMQMKEKLVNIVLGDNRAEVNWGKGPRPLGTKVHRSNFAPGAHDYTLKL